jgi:hypothetical protein
MYGSIQRRVFPVKGKEVCIMEQVIKEQVKKECDKVGICIYEESKGSIRVYPYSQIVSSRLIVAVDMIKEEYAGMVDYYIGYDELRREIYVSVGNSF